MRTLFLALLVLSACSEKPVVLAPSKHIDTSIVRLHDATTGAFFCSAVVISDTRILTAAHCVLRDYIVAVMLVKQVEVRTQDNRPLGIFAHPVAANARLDTAILEGEFSLFDKRPIEIAPQVIEDSFFHSRNIITCGYPAGGVLVCSKVKAAAHFNFGYIAQGFLYPGMSGGPVIDQETGAVIAVNTAVTEVGIYLSPLVELYNQLGL